MGREKQGKREVKPGPPSPARALMRDRSKRREELLPPSYSYSSASGPMDAGSQRRPAAMSVVMVQDQRGVAGMEEDGEERERETRGWGTTLTDESDSCETQSSKRATHTHSHSLTLTRKQAASKHTHCTRGAQGTHARRALRRTPGGT